MKPCLLVILLTGAEAFAQSAQPPSYLDYHPRVSEYPAALASVVGPLARGDAPADLSRALEQSRSIEPALTRGLIDELYFLRGFAEEKRNALHEALGSYDRSLEVRSTNHLAQVRRALVLRKLGRPDRAIAALREVRWASKHLEHEVLYATAQCLLDQKKEAEAVQVLKTVRTLAPNYQPALRLLVELQADTQSLDSESQHALMQDLEALARQNPEDRRAKLLLARHNLRAANPLLGTAELERGRDLAEELCRTSNYADEEAARLLFDLQLKLGDSTGAATTVERGLAANPSSKPLGEAARQLEIQRQGAAAR